MSDKTINISPESINDLELQIRLEDDPEAFVTEWAINLGNKEEIEEDASKLSKKDLLRIHTQDPYEFFG
jgi:hypothetical protein